MTTPAGRLLRRSRLLPGESLPSLLARLAQLNGYDPPSILERACRVGGSPYAPASRSCAPEAFERMAALTDIEPSALYAATAHCFAPLLTRPDEPLETLSLPSGEPRPCLTAGKPSRSLRPDSAAQFCPHCVQEAPYHRLIWTPVAVSACLQHECLLEDGCPKCRAPLPVRAIVVTRCAACEADLTRARSIPVSQDALGLLAQRVLQSWLLGRPLPEGLAAHGLPDQPPAVLYAMLEGLRFGLRQVPPAWRYLHRIAGSRRRAAWPGGARSQPLKPEESYRLFATLFKSLLNWPQGFYEFLRACGCRDNPVASGGWGDDLGVRLWQRFETKVEWRRPAFQFVREALAEYLVYRYVEAGRGLYLRWRRGCPRGSGTFACARLEEAAQLLNLPLDMVKRLGQIGRLASLEPPGQVGHSYQYVRRIDALTLRRQWHEPLSLSEAAVWLGLSREAIQDLVGMGLLAAECRPDVALQTARLLPKQSVIDLWSAVMARVRLRLHPPLDWVPFRLATRRLTALGLSEANLVERVAAGELRAYLPYCASSALDGLLFSKRDLQMCIRGLKAKHKRGARLGILRSRPPSLGGSTTSRDRAMG